MTENKDDLISREALRNTILNDRKLDGSNANWEVNRILVHIENAPIVEAYTEEQVKELVELNKKLSEERPQGEWLPNYTSQYMNPGKQCSLCGKIVEFSENYCPNCGAKMR